jgi:phosphatidyl-myo-inositol dimannoside synthase
MHDRTGDAFDNPYFPAELFTGGNANKVRFSLAAVRQGLKSDVVILSHINLMFIGWLIKKISPRTKVCLFAHGIEVWAPLNFFALSMLRSCDLLLCVSTYTKNQVMAIHGISNSKCAVLNNCIDPFLPLHLQPFNDDALRARYGCSKEHVILFTLSRLSSKDRYKGYDKVFKALALLKKDYPLLRYLVGGGYDAVEKAFVDQEISNLQLQDVVTITGYLPEEELAQHFAMADMYVMPSKKEGFGIVFVEAMYYGLPVIAGNADGSADALLNGQIGLLVDPENIEDIKTAIEKILKNPAASKPDHKLLVENFGYENYKFKLAEIIQNL